MSKVLATTLDWICKFQMFIPDAGFRLLGSILAIFDFHVLYTLWTFTVDFPLMETPSYRFVLTKICEKHHWKSEILRKDAGHWPVSLLKMHSSAVVFCKFY